MLEILNNLFNLGENVDSTKFITANITTKDLPLGQKSTVANNNV